MSDENYARNMKKNGLLYRRKRKLEDLRKEEECGAAAEFDYTDTTDGMVQPNSDITAKLLGEASFQGDGEQFPLMFSPNEEEAKSGKEEAECGEGEAESVEGEAESDEEEDEIDEGAIDFDTMSVSDCLHYFALYTNQKHSAINMLLKILRTKTNVALPKDARALLNTNRKRPKIKDLGNGSFWNRGIRKSLIQSLRFAKVPETLSLNIFIDGLPLHKSSKIQFWPIMINIKEMPQIAPITAAIFCGRTKPKDVRRFMKPLVHELNMLMDVGMVLNNRRVTIKVRAIIADSPARAFLKGVAYFNGKEGCAKCTCEGEFNDEGRCTIFKDTNAPLRTDRNFRHYY
ncbi:uncharacterized protein LOC133391431 [Anopheles gambiae]|uniref:uncharacterized protein LOC133391431 n=1 Tax=Anopheles gambiae TaxID=7165 RepID=UPI002AC932A5|nr:uncharacterized protein LOC133391431 [Anopheles gambiae]